MKRVLSIHTKRMKDEIVLEVFIVKKGSVAILIVVCLCALLSTPTLAQKEMSNQEIYDARMELYLKYEAVTQVPWYYLAAIDQYERSIQRARKDLEEREGLIAITYPKHLWAGALNPNQDDKNIETIQFFGGVGLDGNGDGLADRDDDEDILYTMSQYLASYGFSEDDFKIAVWEYYKNGLTVDVVLTNAQLYETFQTLNLDKHAFPCPKQYNYSYRSTFGDRRGWGGRRIHEGTDIFADYGTPVRSTTYGKIMIKGWNEYGGWRVGIRDNKNNYHYYAHLARFNDDFEEGDIVEPGDVIGYVGSTGYGKPGTSGKFPPHLHYGIYRYNGYIEWSYDPYPLLRKWERNQ